MLPSPPPSLVGRDRELTALRQHLAGALGGQGSLVLVGGEAGIGKTALAEMLCAEAAQQDALVLVGRCYDLSETPPYGPWREVLARAPQEAEFPPPPDLGGGGGVTSQAALFAAVRDYLATVANRQPAVLVLDDLHWADPASLDLLRVVARGLADLPILLLATYRADEVALDHPLAALLPLLVREARAARLDLRPLDRDAIGALVAGRYALPPPEADRLTGYLTRRSEGNALFLGELLRTLEGAGVLQWVDDGWALGELEQVPVPALLRQVIEGRLRRLTLETRQLLAIAAVIGQEVPLAVWAAVSEVAEEVLLGHADRALEARLLAEASDRAGVRFSHALIREAIYAGVSPTRRRGWHRRVAEALTATPLPDPDTVAYHFQRAGDPRAVAWLVRAGLRALDTAQLTAAERFVTAAGLLAEDASHARERGWLLYLGADLLIFADTARGLHYLGDVDRLATLAGERALLANGHYLRGQVYVHAGQLRAGVAAIEQGVAAIQGLPGDDAWWAGDQLALARIGALLPEGERAATLSSRARRLPPAQNQRSELANWYAWAGRYREAWALDEATSAASGGDSVPHQTPGGWGLAHALGPLGRPEEARRAYARARADSYARNDLYVVVSLLLAELQHVIVPYQADDVPERTRLAAEAARAWNQVQGAAITAPYPSHADLPVALLDGRWAEAHRIAEAGGAVATINHAQSASALLGILARNQGAYPLAWAQVRALHPAGPATEPGDCCFIPGLALQALAAELALDAGDLARAEGWIAAHRRWLDWSGAVLWRADHRLLQARHCWAADDLRAARVHAEAALALAREPRQPLALLQAHRLLGELATAAGCHSDAQPHLDAALALAEACAAPYERALTLLALAELHLATGEGEAAAEALAEARASFVPLAAAPALARADVLAGRLAAVPVATPPFGLTAREVEVLRLVVAGLTNPQVANRLFVTPRTVNGHLTSIYTKLGVAGRAAAIRLALDHGLC